MLGSFELLLGGHQLGILWQGGGSGCLILSHTGVNFFEVALDGGGSRLEETAEVHVAVLAHIDHDVADFGLIGGVAVEHAQSAVDGEVGVDFVGRAELESEVVLTALHVAVHVVALCAEGLELVGNVAHDALEGAESVGKLTAATASGHREVELPRPVALVVGGLQRGDEGGIGGALEGFYALSVVLASQGVEWIGGGYGAGLPCILPVEAYVETFGQESHTGGVGVDTVEADGGVAGGIAQEVDTLVRVG